MEFNKLDVLSNITLGCNCRVIAQSMILVHDRRFHRGRGLFLLLAVATGFYMLKVQS